MSGPIEHLMRQAERLMRQAEARDDLDTWVKHYLIWIELVPLRIREGSALARLVSQVHKEESDGQTFHDLPFYHPAVG